MLVMTRPLTERPTNHVGTWLRDIRIDAGKNQKEVAPHGHISDVQLSRIENGESGTRRETIIGIATYLNAPIDDLNRALMKEGFAPLSSDESDLAKFLGELEATIPIKKRAKFRQALKDQAKLTASIFTEAA